MSNVADECLAPTKDPCSHKLTWVFLLLIAVAAATAHWQSVNFPFASYDDHLFVYQNHITLQGLTLNGLHYAFTDVGSDINWVPMARLSHMLDVQLYGVSPWGHHLTNIILHVANAMLFFWLLVRLTKAHICALLAAMLFAVHPIHVESVAWIAERRDVLSMFFGLLAMLAYVRYVRSVIQMRWIGWYLLVCLCTLLAVMAKPSMVTLPCVLWLLDYWPLRRLEVFWKSVSESADGSRDIWQKRLAILADKLPLFGLVSISVWFTLKAQANSMATTDLVPWSQRLVRLPLAYADYLMMLIWPVNLSPLYANRFGWSVLAVCVSLAVLLLISFWVVRNWKRRPYLLMGWLWYLGTLIPMIGLISVGLQTHACRYAYFPFLGLYIILGWFFGRWYMSLQARGIKRIAMVFAGLVVVALITGTWRQSQVWSSDEALYTATSRTTKLDNPILPKHAWKLYKQGDVKQARALLRGSAASSLGKSRFPLNMLITLEMNQGNLTYANSLGDFLTRIKKANFTTMGLLGDIAMKQDNYQRAIVCYQRSIDLNPQPAMSFIGIGMAHEKLNEVDKAGQAYAEAIKRQPTNMKIFHMAGMMFYHAGDYEKAVQWLGPFVNSKATEDHASSWFAMGISLSRMGKLAESEQAYRQAINLEPEWSEANNSLGVVMIKQGRLGESIEAFEKAVAQDSSNAQALDNLNRAKAILDQQKKPAPAEADDKPVL